MKQLKYIIFFTIWMLIYSSYGQKRPAIFEKAPLQEVYSKAFAKPMQDSSISIYQLDSMLYVKKPKWLETINVPIIWRDSLCMDSNSIEVNGLDSMYLVGRIDLGSGLTGYLIDYDGNNCMSWGSSCLYVCSESNPAFCQEIKYSEGWGCEGGSGYSESWLIDYNADGKVDLLRKDCRHLMPDQDTDKFIETYHLYVREDGGFRKVEIPDAAALIKKFKIVEHSLY